MYLDNSMGGAERRFIRIFSAMPKSVYAEILILESGRGVVKELIAPFVNENSHVKIFSNIWQLLIYIRREKFECIAGFTAGGRFILLSVMAILWGIKRLFLSVESSSSNLVFTKDVHGFLLKCKYYSCIRLSTWVDCLYPSSTPVLRNFFPKNHFSTTENSFTDLSVFKPIREKKNLIVFASTFISVKNPDLFIKGVELIQDEIRKSGYKCILCGNGPMEVELKKMPLESGCSDIIEFPGRVAMEKILPQAKIFCSLQSVTNYPSQSLIEAIACGCYCIATDCGDTKLLIKPEFGKLVSFTPQAIADGILDAIQCCKTEQQIIIENSRVFALDKCNISTSVHYFEKLICKI